MRKSPDFPQANLWNDQHIFPGVSNTNHQRSRQTQVRQDGVEEFDVDSEVVECLPGTGAVVDSLKEQFSRPLDFLQGDADQDDSGREVVDKTEDDLDEVDELHRGGGSDKLERLLEEFFTSFLGVLDEGMIHVVVEDFHNGVNPSSHPQKLILVHLGRWVEGFVVDERENVEDEVSLFLLVVEETNIQNSPFVCVPGFLFENTSQTYDISMVYILLKALGMVAFKLLEFVVGYGFTFKHQN